MRIFNKRAKYEYKLEGEKIEAGIVLSGGEAKSIRGRHLDLSQSTVRILNNEAYLINANIPVQGAKNYNSTRMRKLLLHRHEIVSLATLTKQRKLTLVPISIYNSNRKTRIFKLALALGKPKRKFEKRETLKNQDIQRDIEKEFRGKV